MFGSIEDDKFSNGVSDCLQYHNFMLPFHPTHQFVERTQCTMEALEQSSRDKAAS
jgi:hypothetical protein